MLKLQAKGVAIWVDEHHWTNSSLCTFIGMKHISHTFMYILPMYLRLTTFTKTLPQMSFHLYFFAIFISLWGSTHDSADCWSAHRSSAARASFKRVHDWCKVGWRRPGAPPPPKQISWLRRWPTTNNSDQRLLERELRTVIHVKSAKRFDPVGWFDVPSVSRKWFAGMFGVEFSPQNHRLKSAKIRGNKIGFYFCKRAKGKNNVISYLGDPRVRNDQCKHWSFLIRRTL